VVLDELFEALVPGEADELLFRLDELDELRFGEADELDEFGELVELDEFGELLELDELGELLELDEFGELLELDELRLG